MRRPLTHLATVLSAFILLQISALPARALSSIPRVYGRVRTNSSRFHLDHFVREAASAVPAGALVLDAGAGQGPYRHHFAHARYESADVRQVKGENGRITYVCDLADIPVEANRYDLVVCTQVLQYAPEPKALLRELHRVLKPGGELWLSAPFFYEEERAEPPDLFRFTRHGLRYLLTASGFEVKRLEWLEGYFGTLSYQLDVAWRFLPRHPRNYGGGLSGVVAAGIAAIVKPVAAMLSILFARADQRRRYVLRGHGHCKNHAVVAMRVAQPAS